MEREEYLKARHRCTKCQKRDERTLAGQSLCEECRQKNLTRLRERRSRLKSEQRCTECGTQDKRTLAGFSMCNVCAEKLREYERKRPPRRRSFSIGKVEEPAHV